MNGSKALFFVVGIAGTALLAAVAVYCFVRDYPPELLAPLKTTIPVLAGHTDLFGSAPSFFYTFAFGLIIGICASTRTCAKRHCLTWLGIALLLEVSQHVIVAKPMIAWLTDRLSVASWKIISPYWSHGVFDPLDIIATIAGGMFSLSLLNYSKGRGRDDHL